MLTFAPGETDPLLELPFDPDLHRTGDVWHIFIQGLAPGVEYGYRVARNEEERNNFV